MNTRHGLALRDFQQAFAAALFDSADASPEAPLASLRQQPGFMVYRNTVRKGCIDALEANYPAVARLVGHDWFRAAAAVHVNATPPSDGRLMVYGADFAAFLARFEPAAALTYLPGVARLDRFWTEAHLAADAPLLDGGALASHTPAQLANLVLTPHPAARWAWFDDAPIYTVWQRNRTPDHASSEPAPELAWRGEGALLTRPEDSVATGPLDRAGAVFLDACAAAQPLGSAATMALATQPGVDLAQLLAHLLRAGAFTITATTGKTP